jgi:hypothetical protein
MVYPLFIWKDGEIINNVIKKEIVNIYIALRMMTEINNNSLTRATTIQNSVDKSKGGPLS